MTVDLSKAKEGDVAKFRCGGERKITLVEPSERRDSYYWIHFEEQDGRGRGVLFCRSDGEVYDLTGVSPFDIIAIETGGEVAP